MKKCDFNVTGMSCAACVAHVEKAARSVKGTDGVVVNLLTGGMRVTGDFDEKEIIKAVEGAGYKAEVAGAATGSNSSGGKTAAKSTKVTAAEEAERRRADVKDRIVRLSVSAVFLVLIFYVSMSYSMNMFPLPDALRTNAVAVGIIEEIVALAVIFVNAGIFKTGLKRLLKLRPNMDSLVALGTVSSFGYSFAVLLITALRGDAAAHPDFYFESAVMILTFIGAGKLLEAVAKGKASDAVTALTELAPDDCTVVRNGEEIKVKTADVAVSEIISVKPGDRVPLDCEIVSGETEIDESPVTGESVPVYRKAGDKAICGTVNITGAFFARVTNASGETTVDKMAQAVREISATKAPVSRVADKVAAVFVPAVVAIATVTFAAWMIGGQTVGFALARAVSVLVVSCPCALGLATPVAIICGSAAAARNGVLFKTSEAIEKLAKVRTVIFDKTGTLTEGKMAVAGVDVSAGSDERELVLAAASAEQGSTHPIAAAIVEYAKARFGDGFVKTDACGVFTSVPGKGVVLKLPDGGEVRCGNADFVTGAGAHARTEDSFHGSEVFVEKNGKYLGRILLEDSLRADAAECVQNLKKRGCKTYMLTGDNENAARYVAEKTGLDGYRAKLLPAGKTGAIKELSQEAKTAMVGDGINDAPALTQADTGIAIGCGTDIAIEAADVVITGRSLVQVSGAVRLARKTLIVIYENLFWAFGYNIIGIPLAAGVFGLINGTYLDPSFSALAMSVSSVLVVTNALRLLLIGGKYFKSNRRPETVTDENAVCENGCAIQKEENIMVETTVEVTGMMCGNCERHVNNAVKGAFEVESVVSDHENNRTVIVSKNPLDEEKLRAVIEEEGYKAGKILVK